MATFPGTRVFSDLTSVFEIPRNTSGGPVLPNWEQGAAYPLSQQKPPVSGEFIVSPPIDVNPYASTGGSRVRTYFEDYYNRIHIEPQRVEFGFIAEDKSVAVRVWNSFYDRPVNLVGISFDPGAGLAVTGSPVQAIAPLGVSDFTVTAFEEGAVSLAEDVVWDFDSDGEFAVSTTGIRASKWSLEPNWPPAGQPYQVTHAFKTEVITSHSGREQRLALRSSPRKSLDFQVLLDGDGYRRFKDLSRASHHRGLLMPELTRFVATTTSSMPGNVLTLPVVPRWIQPGVTVWLQFLSATETHRVESVNGNEIEFATLDAAAWPVGTKVHPLLVGYLASELPVNKLTNSVGTLNAKFEVSPLSEPVISPPPPVVTFNGREVFLKKPNWANSVSGRFGRDVAVLDYGRGPVSRFHPVDFSYERTKATYLNRTGVDAQEMLDLFLRMRGQQGEFYAPTWEYDFKPAGTVLAGSSGMFIENTAFAEDYRFSTVHKNVFVQFNDGTVILRKVTAITPVVGGAQLQVEGAWGRTFTADGIAMCGWLLVRRFTSDTLVVEWLTDSVAQVVLNLTTLEDLPG